jgi:hypothetical protein
MVRFPLFLASKYIIFATRSLAHCGTDPDLKLCSFGVAGQDQPADSSVGPSPFPACHRHIPEMMLTGEG